MEPRLMPEVCFKRVTVQPRSKEGAASSRSLALVRELADMPKRLCIPGPVHENVLSSQIQSWKSSCYCHKARMVVQGPSAQSACRCAAETAVL